MSEIKQLLKDAKNELSGGYFEDVIPICLEVLKLDENNYWAHVFLGKSFASLERNKDYTKSVKHYILATKIQPENLLAWKGLFLLFFQDNNTKTNSDIIPELVSFEQLFTQCDRYMSILRQLEQPQVDLIHSLRLLLKQNKESLKFQLDYWKHYIPGESPYETLGKHVSRPLDSLQNLIKFAKIDETDKINKLVTNERLKLSVSDPLYQTKINSIAWEVYKHSQLDQYYDKLINLIDNDQKRQDWESEWLEYRVKILKSMPQERKADYFEQLVDMVDGMVMLNHSSLMAWKYFFDWKDWNDLNSIDQNLIMNFFHNWPMEPLAIILYLWLNSTLSDYNTKEIIDNFNKDKTDNKVKTDIEQLTINDNDIDEENNELEDIMEVENNNKENTLSEDDISVAILDNISKIKNSTLAYRITSHFFLLNKEYGIALPYIRSGISLIPTMERDFGCNLLNTKRQLSIALATGYTYVDAPRNHNYALSLFDKILQEDSTITNAKLGKAIIYIERSNWEGANALLSEVVVEAPNNLEVLSQLAWSKAHLNEFDEALNLFVKVLNDSLGLDLRSIQFKCENLWRQAKTYLMRYATNDDRENMNDIKLAFKILISIVKFNPDSFAKSYSTLGDIYANYYEDQNRAYKCYFKSFELDYSDIVAAKYITEIYTANGNWNAAADIAERLVKAESAKKELRIVNWPYRVIGISYLEKQQESESIEWFQSALRVEPNDVESWVGLGQAYLACGRIEASIKVFEKARELDHSHIYAQYFIALSQNGMGEFEQSVEILKEITKLKPKEIVFHVSLVTTLVAYAYDLYNQGYLMKSVSIALEAIELINYITVELHHSNQNIWITVSKCLHLFILVESQIELLPLETLIDIFQSSESEPNDELYELDNISLEGLLDSASDDNIHIACTLLILASKIALMSVFTESLPATVRASLWNNVGIAELIGYTILKDPKYRDSAIFSFKKSIKFQSNTVESWIGLGIATMDINYRVAQHAFIKALSFAPKETGIWFNLAILGLKNNDVEFAEEVLSRIQSLAPQTSSPWLGMALVLKKRGKKLESSNMLAHSFSLSNGRSKIIQLLYGKSVLEKRIGSDNDELNLDSLEELNAVASGLEQFFKKSPNNTVAIECALLVFERLHNYKEADILAARLTSIFEERFEKTQNEEELFNYGIIKAQLARIQLGFGEYEKAIENANLSEGILTDFDKERTRYAQLSNYICLGLSNFFLDNFDETLEQFQQILAIEDNSDKLIILITQVLYDIGTSDTKEIALQQLTDYISENGFNLMITLTIAVITILEGNLEDLKIILEELKRISLKGMISDKHRDVPDLINQINIKLNDKQNQTFSQRTAFFFPNDNNSWNHTDSKIKQRLMVGGQNRVSIEDISDSYATVGNLTTIQRSNFLCPWNGKAVKALKSYF